MMKLWPVVAVAAMSSAFVWACSSEPLDGDGEGGQGGEGTGGGTGSGGTGSGGTGTGGTGTGGNGGNGGMLSCEPEDGSEAWGGAGGVGGAGAVAIFGDWTDQYGSTYSVDESTISSSYTTYDVVGISESGEYIVALNAEDAGYYPCLYSRFDWTEDDGNVYWCRSVLDAASVEEALARPAADRDDLEAGCGSGFPWSQLTPQ